MSLPARAMAALLVAAAVSACSHPVSNDPAANPSSVLPTTKREKVLRLPDPCNILGGMIETAHLDRFWKRPVGRDINTGPNLIVKATQCRYKDKDNPNPDARVAIEFRTQNAQQIVDRFGGRDFEQINIDGRTGFKHFVEGQEGCGVIIDFKFGLMIIGILQDNSPKCERAVDIAKIVDPWFAQWE